jgi:predicted O-methyltransferase YrrM
VSDRVAETRAVEERAVDESLVGPVFGTVEELDRFHAELLQSGLVEHLEQARVEFEGSISGTTPRGNPYRFGASTTRASNGRLYAIVRKLRPQVVVETGVCNGVSTAIILQSLSDNRQGRLYSLDFPEFTGETGGHFWSGKGGAVVPAGREPGWAIPDGLRGRWELILGQSQEKLPSLLERLDRIDLFLHDSEHSYECMTFEYRLAFPHLAEGGVLASDDVTSNSAFEDFAASVSRPVRSLGGRVAMLLK